MRPIKCYQMNQSSEITMKSEDSHNAQVHIISIIHIHRRDRGRGNIKISSRVRAIIIEGINEIRDGKIVHLGSNSCTTYIAPNRQSSTEILAKQTDQGSIANSERKWKDKQEPTLLIPSESTQSKQSGSKQRQGSGMNRRSKCINKDRGWSFGNTKMRPTMILGIS